MVSLIKAVGSFDMVWPYDPVGSFDMAGPFDMFGPFEPVGSFDLVGPFEEDGLFEYFYIASFNNMQTLRLNSSSCCICHRCQTISNKNVQFNRPAQSGMQLLNWFEYVAIRENHNQWLGLGVQSLDSKSIQWFGPVIAIF